MACIAIGYGIGFMTFMTAPQAAWLDRCDDLAEQWRVEMNALPCHLGVLEADFDELDVAL